MDIHPVIIMYLEAVVILLLIGIVWKQSVSLQWAKEDQEYWRKLCRDAIDAFNEVVYKRIEISEEYTAKLKQKQAEVTTAFSLAEQNAPIKPEGAKKDVNKT